MILPKFLSSRLIGGASLVKNISEQLAAVLVPLYVGWGNMRSQSSHASVDFTSILQSTQNKRHTDFYIDDEVSQMWAKNIFFTWYNWKKGTFNVDAKTDWKKTIGYTMLWWLYNSGTKKNKNTKGIEGLEALLG